MLHDSISHNKKTESWACPAYWQILWESSSWDLLFELTTTRLAVSPSLHKSLLSYQSEELYGRLEGAAFSGNFFWNIWRRIQHSGFNCPALKHHITSAELIFITHHQKPKVGNNLSAWVHLWPRYLVNYRIHFIEVFKVITGCMSTTFRVNLIEGGCYT